ncbi:MAG: hypothetical protein CMJ48_06715 [Planctomycetaceae bacterium]|nr:hypothetical protein [Planctomycetaceae bacterium]
MVRFDGFHCENVVGPMGEEHSRHDPGRKKLFENTHDRLFAPNPIQSAEPGRLGSQLFTRLFDHEIVPVSGRDPQDDVRDAPGEQFCVCSPTFWQAAARLKPGNNVVRIQFVHRISYAD